MLLVGFFLNLFGLMRRSSLKYVLLNLFGGGLACTASILIEFFPSSFWKAPGQWLLLWASGGSFGPRSQAGSGLSLEPEFHQSRTPSRRIELSALSGSCIVDFRLRSTCHSYLPQIPLDCTNFVDASSSLEALSFSPASDSCSPISGRS